jgi:chaperonin GroEL
VQEGILPGGGVAVMRALKTLDALKAANDDQKVGINIVRRALQAPARQIAKNGGEDGAVVAGNILDSSDSFPRVGTIARGESADSLVGGRSAVVRSVR